MYSKEITFTIRYKEIELDCDCQVSKIHYDYGRTSKEDVIESVDTVNHKGENITELLDDDKLNDIWNLCYEEYYA